jgi:hypothetical protein
MAKKLLQTRMNSPVPSAMMIVLVFALITALLNLFTIFGVVYRKWMVVRKYSYLITLVLLFSFLHSLLTYLRALFVYFDIEVTMVLVTWPILVLGHCVFTSLIIAHLELLVLFAPLAPGWSSLLIFKLKWTAVLLQFILNFPVLIYPLVESTFFSVEIQTIFRTVLGRNVVDYHWYFGICYCSLHGLDN